MTSDQNSTASMTLRLCLWKAASGPLSQIDGLIQTVQGVTCDQRLKNLKLRRTKLSNIVKHVIAPDVVRRISQAIGSNRYSLLLDGSNSHDDKYFGAVIRYIDFEDEVIRVMPLGVFEVTSGSGEHMAECCERIAKTYNVSLEKCLAVGMDNATPMTGKKTGLTGRLRKFNPNMIQVCCVCHSLQLCVKFALDCFDPVVKSAIHKPYMWFGKSLAKWEAYSEVWRQTQRTATGLTKPAANLNPKKLVSPSQTRWNYLNELVPTLLSQQEALIAYFKGLKTSAESHPRADRAGLAASSAGDSVDLNMLVKILNNDYVTGYLM